MAKLHQKTTTKDLAIAIAKQTGLRLEEVRHVLECLPFYIYESIAKNKDVTYTNLGRFRRVFRKARHGSNFRGGSAYRRKTYRMNFTPYESVRKKLQELANK
jgi:nucleoid DNA-binding protein